MHIFQCICIKNVTLNEWFHSFGQMTPKLNDLKYYNASKVDRKHVFESIGAKIVTLGAVFLEIQ